MLKPYPLQPLSTRILAISSDFRRVSFLLVAAVMVVFLCGCGSMDSSTRKPRATLLFCGDLMLDWGIMESCDTHGYEYPLEHLSSLLKDFDFCFCNLECVISDTATPRPGKKYIFRASSRYLRVLTSAGISGVTLANNHIMDYGETGLMDTMVHLDAQNILRTGAGTNASNAYRPMVTNIRGIRLAVMGICALRYEESYADSKTAGIARGNISSIAPVLKKYRDWNDIIAISIHWGNEYSDFPEKSQVTLAHQLIDAGADIIIGHHPHVYQGVEIYKNKPILYSLGNFLFGSINEDVRDNIVAGFTVEKNTVKKMVIYTIHGTNDQNNPFRPQQIKGKKAEDVLTHLVNISMPLGSTFPGGAKIKGDAIEYEFKNSPGEPK
ncbi:MAG: CapA family protein [Spirochaetota bacterium]